jgi:hypothetical protein
MERYAHIYSDFLLFDGTHWADKFADILMPPLVVDCLGKTMPVGWIISPSENKEAAVDGFKQLGLHAYESRLEHDGESTLMTDGAPLFIALADEFHFVHLLCIDHYRATISTAGFGQAADSTFKSDANELLFRNYHTPEAFKSAFNTMRQTFTTPAASSWLNDLWPVREKVCLTFTKEYFTCGHKATQRAESYNSSVKGGASMAWNTRLKGFNHYQLFNHLKNDFDGKMAKVSIITRSLCCALC